MSIQELALPVANWKKPQEAIVSDIASVILDFQRKPNIYWTTPSELLRLADTNRKGNEIYNNETTATLEMVLWAAFSDTEYLAWISEPKRGFYKSLRGVLCKKFEEGKNIRIMNVAFFLPLNSTQSINLFEVFANIPKNTLEAEDNISTRPVEFNLPENKTFGDLVYLLTGKTISELTSDKISALNEAKIVVQKKYQAILSTRTIFDEILVGAIIEQNLISLGHAIHLLGDCPGILNSEALKILQTSLGIYIKNPDRYKYDKTAVCRRCGTEKKVADCKICRECQILFDQEELAGA